MGEKIGEKRGDGEGATSRKPGEPLIKRSINVE
jgi:hypothetical protein